MTVTSARIGIDLGGTKIEGVVLDSRGVERLRRRVATPHGDYQGTIAAVAQLISALENEAGEVEAIGVGTPGSPSRASGLMKNCNSTWLNGQPLRADLERALGRAVVVANDADCFALSEATDGAARGARLVFGVILGTGVGGGLVVDGRLVSGPNGISGEWGHVPLPWPADDERPGPVCYCGRLGCIETFVSGPALAAQHARVSAAGLDAAGIAEAARAGDTLALASLERYAERLARGLALVIDIVDPDVIVLGGGMSNVEPLYLAVPELWKRWVFSDRIDTRLVRAMHGDSSGVRGAARLG